jgi:CRP-like cAMP-binding protein
VFGIGAAAYEILMDEVPGFARALMREFARRHDGALRLLEGARHRPAGERLAIAITQLIRDGRSTPADRAGGRRLRATQAELAALANLSRQTVNELLAAWAHEGRVRTAYAGLWVAPGWLPRGAP